MSPRLNVYQAAVCALLTAAGVAQAANVVDVDVVVKSSSMKQLTIPRSESGGFFPMGAPGSPSSYTLLTRISIDTRGTGDGASGVKSWNLELVGTSEAQKREFQPKTSQSYSIGNKPNLVSQDVALVVSVNALAIWGKQLCDSKLAAEMKLHYDPNYARAQEYKVYVDFHPKLSYKTSPGDKRGGMDAVSQKERMTFVCAGAPAPAPAPAASVPTGPARIDSVQLELNYPASPASCPIDAAVKATFRATHPGPFKARVVSASGRASTWRTFVMQNADRQPTGLWVKTWNEALKVPGNASGGTAGGGLMGNGAGGVAARPSGPSEGIQPAGARPPVGAGGYAAPNAGPNVHQDALWVEIADAAPGSAAKSDSGSYRVTCPMTTMPTAGALSGGADPQRPGSTPGLVQQPGAGRAIGQIPHASIPMPAGPGTRPNRAPAGTPSSAPPIGPNPSMPPPAGVPSALPGAATPTFPPTSQGPYTPTATPGATQTPTFPPPAVPASTPGIARPALSTPSTTRSR